ncbi:MAG TPA: SAVED domain-containing protein [bacterium]|nr:SAVED domain-containing protein [bacterium]
MWNSISNLADVFQIISMVIFLYGACVFYMRSRRYKKVVEEAKTVSAKPMALIICVSGTDITAQVLRFLAKKNMPMDHESYIWTDGILAENITYRLADILKLKDKMTHAGVTEVHLFMMAPLAFAVAVGAVLDNWVRVNVYHLNREKNEYECWTYLHKGFVPGLGYSKTQELLNE